MGKFSQKWVKKQRIGYISEAISPTDFILGTMVQPNKLHPMTLVSMTLTLGQGQRSRSKFSKNGLNTKQLATYLMLFHPHTSSYLLSQLFVTHLGVALLFFFFNRLKLKAFISSHQHQRLVFDLLHHHDGGNRRLAK